MACRRNEVEFLSFLAKNGQGQIYQGLGNTVDLFDIPVMGTIWHLPGEVFCRHIQEERILYCIREVKKLLVGTFSRFLKKKQRRCLYNISWMRK